MPVSALDRKYAAMRAIGRTVDYHRDQERLLRPRMNVLAVGSADFDHLLKATVGETYLRVLRQGGSAEQARVEATNDGNECVTVWNSKTHKTRAHMTGTYELQRWVSAGEAEADAVHLTYLNMMRATG